MYTILQRHPTSHSLCCKLYHTSLVTIKIYAFDIFEAGIMKFINKVQFIDIKSSLDRNDFCYPIVKIMRPIMWQQTRICIESTHLEKSEFLKFCFTNFHDFSQPNNLEKTQDRQSKESILEPCFESLHSWI